MREASREELDKIQKTLLAKASNALLLAYNPYSKFYVGAAVLTPDGKIFTNGNMENSAYGSTVCAERNAIIHANAHGYRRFDKLALITKGEGFATKDVSGPCGSCRQMLYESRQLADSDMEVILSNTDMDRIVITSIDELLPLAFGPRDVGVDIKKYRGL